MVTNKKIKVVDDVIEVPAKKYITTDGMEFIDGNAADIHQAQLDLAEKAKLCFEKYGIYTTDDVLIEEDALNGNEEITKDDYLFTRVLHTDMIDIDEMYILQANDENAQRKILNLFCSYLRNVKDDCFLKKPVIMRFLIRLFSVETMTLECILHCVQKENSIWLKKLWNMEEKF